MRKRLGAIMIAIIIITVLVCYYLFPVVREFIDAIAALITFLGILIAILLWLYSPRHEKERTKEGNIEKKEIGKDIEAEIPAIASPISGLCLGRDTELSQLEKDVTRKNVLLIRGIAGIGKTTLGLKFKSILEKRGYHILWYQCDSESYEGFLIYLSSYLKTRGSVTYQVLRDQSTPSRERLKIAVQELCTYPTVVFLDNFQVLDDSGFRVFKDHLRNSTLVLMSRVQPGFLLESYENLQSLDRNSSSDLLKTLEVKESLKVLEKIHEKTGGHPWSLVRFADLARVLPVKNLLDELPDFGREQENYINEECWKCLDENEKEFLMRASVFTKPLTFEAIEACSKKGMLSEVLLSLARKFYLVKREEYYYIHDIMKDFALSKLQEDPRLYTEAERAAADYYRKLSSAENLLLMYYHLKEAGCHKEGLDSIMENIDCFWREGYWSDVKEVLEESLNSFGDEKTRAEIYFCLGTIMYELSEWDKAIDYLEKDLEISRKLEDIHSIAQTYNNLGSVHAKRGEWDKAIDCYEKSLEIKEKCGDVHGMAQTYNNLGLVHVERGEWDRAMDYYEKSLEIFEKCGDVHGMAQTYNNLGLVHAKKGEWDKAIDCYRESLEIKEKCGDVYGMAQTFDNLGLVYAKRGEWDKAMNYYEKSLEIFGRLGDVHGMAQTYNNLGSVYAKRGEWDKAMDYYKKSLEIRKKIGDTHGMALTRYGIANALLERKEFISAISSYLESEIILKELGDRYNLMTLYYDLSLCFTTMNLKDVANEYYHKYDELRKQLGIKNP